MPAVITRRLRITGRVQGVYYRASLAQEASRLGVSGWVRNRMDGSVEAVASGPAEAVASIIEWAKRGPDLARVASVEVSESEGMYEGFEQRETE